MNGDGADKILLVRMGALGDIVHALPAQQLLARRLPQAEIHWLAEPHYAPMLRCVPGLHRVWEADTKRWRRGPLHWEGFPNLVRRLRAEGFDLAFDFQGLFKSALLTWLSGTMQIWGFKPERFKEKGCDWFYTAAIEGEADLSRHVIETNIRLVGQVVGHADTDPRIELSIPQPDRDYIHSRLRGLRLDGQAPVLINPGAGWETKLWPASHYARLSLRIEERLGLPVVFTYGPGEEPLLEEIRRVRAGRPTRAFDSTIVQLAELCRRSRLMVAGDSGPMHLAVAVGTPVVAVMGPTDPRRNGPANPEDEVVKRNLPCSNSYKRRCNQFICMDIPVDRVMAAVERRLQKLSPRPPLELSVPS